MSNKDCNLSHEELLSVLHYDSDTGKFTWLITRQRSRKYKAGDTAEYLRACGYCYITVLGREYLAHRLAWFYVNKEWPLNEIDHFNGCRTDNRLSNLREATHAENCQNIKRANRRSSSGVLGVFPKRRKWKASIAVNGKTIPLGIYETKESASEAYISAKRIHHPFSTI